MGGDIWARGRAGGRVNGVQGVYVVYVEFWLIYTARK